MAGEETTNQGGGNIRPEYNTAQIGLNMDQSLMQVQKGKLTYALNAAVENFDSNSVSYQNEPGNEFCLQFPTGYLLIGEHFINEQNKHIFFLANPETGGSQIGYMDNNDCVYRIYINATCLNFNINNPIHKIVHKITNCTTEIYWTDGVNPRRYLDLNKIPYIIDPTSDLCNPVYTNEVDCNQLKLQPNFTVPELDVVDVVTGGSLKSGTYQFAIQYASASGEGYTSYYSVTNPTPIADTRLTTINYDYEVGKSIVVNISNLDATGQFQYFNLAVIKTINSIASVELIGTYFIEKTETRITYTGQNQTQIRLTINDIFEKYPYYEIAQDLTTVQDVLVWDNLTSIDRINYQSIASKLSLYWQTYRIPVGENYADELNATNLRGYMRDEVYAFEIVFILKNGKQTDGFHIPGRAKNNVELYTPDVPTTNNDFIGEPERYVGGVGYSPYWKIYNTAGVGGPLIGVPNIGNATPYQEGYFGYWESQDETYPCNSDVWGDLAGEKIRHHRFPDVKVSPIFESATPTITSNGKYAVTMRTAEAVFPIGAMVDVVQLKSLIDQSSLTQDQKDDIVAFKIVRGNRDVNRSIVAKGILRNVGKYTREDQSFYYPNYPYNDLREDPFINANNNAWTQLCKAYSVNITSFGSLAYGELQYVSCDTNKTVTSRHDITGPFQICSAGMPIILSPATGTVSEASYEVWRFYSQPPDDCVACFCQGFGVTWTAPDGTIQYEWVEGWPEYRSYTKNVKIGTTPYCSSNCGTPGNYDPPCGLHIEYQYTVTATSDCGINTPQPGISGTELGYRQVFNSPDTSFGQPFLGDVLKLENVMYGAGKGHHVEVRKNALYKLLSKEAQSDALDASIVLGQQTTDFNASAMFAAYQAYLTIYVNGITKRNYAYSFNSIASYDYSGAIDNGLGIKQRELDIAQYLIPAFQSTGDGLNVNNWQRESSVYLKTKDTSQGVARTALPYPNKTSSLIDLTTGQSRISDESRYTVSERGYCGTPAKESAISVVSYYASIKNISVNQWGQIYSYDTIDTGFQASLLNVPNYSLGIVFGGDTFINRFAFKTKLPFFFDNRVGAPDDSEIFYDEVGNVAYPVYWHSSRSILSGKTIPSVTDLPNIISYKAHNFDCYNSQATPPSSSTNDITGSNRTFYDGYFYLFAYGIPNFYCESSVNVDLRQATNIKEGDFWPHVSTSIPDDWVQESYVSIAFDNTYNYNPTFSKQNKENFFSHLPPDWKAQLCYTNYPFRAIYSEAQDQNADVRVNSWLTYKPIAFFDFPQNYGKLTSLDGIQNRAVLARFENKSLLYNTLLTVQTSNPQAAYLGNDTLFKSSPPIDFAETDLGYVGSQNKMLLKIPQGQVTVDAKRGQVFLVAGNQASDLSAFGSGLNRFFTDHLAFEILRYFPKIDTDNHFTGIGLHGVYDSKFDRVIITKHDYIPLDPNIKYDEETKEFYIEEEVACIETTSTTSSSSTSTTSTSTSSSTSTTTSSTTLEPVALNLFTVSNSLASSSITAIFNITYTLNPGQSLPVDYLETVNGLRVGATPGRMSVQINNAGAAGCLQLLVNGVVVSTRNVPAFSGVALYPLICPPITASDTLTINLRPGPC